jgi:hypothetical protein
MRLEETTLARSTAHCFLLAAILLQAVPLVLCQPVPFEKDVEEVSVRSLVALSICDDHEDPANSLGSGHCLQGPVLSMPSFPKEGVPSLATSESLPGGFTLPVFRPPRNLSSRPRFPGRGMGLSLMAPSRALSNRCLDRFAGRGGLNHSDRQEVNR